MITKSKATITSQTGPLAVTVFDNIEAKKVLVIASATGVKQEFYKKFALFLAEHKITVLTFDYAGIGQSLTTSIKVLKHNAADWGNKDLESIFQYVKKNFAAYEKYVLGHSIGGQLLGMAPSIVDFNKIILIASQSGYWRYWKGFGQVKMWFNWYVLFPALLNSFGYLPSKKVSGMEDLPKNVANQWRNWGKHKKYIFSELNHSSSLYSRLRLPVTAVSIDDDEFAPKGAADWMAAQYSTANKKFMHLIPKDFDTHKIGHFGLFKSKFQNSVWKILVKEVV